MLWAILDIFKKLTVLCKPSCTVYETLCIKKKTRGGGGPNHPSLFRGKKNLIEVLPTRTQK